MSELSLEACARSYEAGQACLVSARLAGDLETPVSAFLKLSAGRAGRIFLLESVEGGAARGRYSMIGLDPDIVWRVSGGKAEINRRALADPGGFLPCAGPPLAALRELIAESRIETPDDLPPMAAGVFGYLGYDMVREMERLSAAKPDPIGVPDALMLRPTVMVVFDAVKDEIFIVTPLRPDRDSGFRAAYGHARERLESVVAALEGPLAREPHAGDPALTTDQPRSNTPKERFFEMVERAKNYIRAGDIFQVVLSQRFSAAFALPAFALYRALRRINP
ncbi:MAG: chorismate-binding protein, partial [Methylocella sp.]